MYSSDFTLVGNVGKISKFNDGLWLLAIAENIYHRNPDTDIYEKTDTIWYSLMATFEPRVNVGDRVIAKGVFTPSRNENFPYAMRLRRIGVIKQGYNSRNNDYYDYEYDDEAEEEYYDDEE